MIGRNVDWKGRQLEGTSIGRDVNVVDKFGSCCCYSTLLLLLNAVVDSSDVAGRILEGMDPDVVAVRWRLEEIIGRCCCRRCC